MKTSAFSQAALLVVGGVAVLLIGALVKFDPGNATAVTMVELPAPAGAEAAAPADDIFFPENFPPGLAQIVKLTRAGLHDDVILAYLQQSGDTFSPTADQLLFLQQCGVSQAVMAALVNARPKPVLPTPSPGQLAMTTPGPPPPASSAWDVPPVVRLGSPNTDSAAAAPAYDYDNSIAPPNDVGVAPTPVVWMAPPGRSWSPSSEHWRRARSQSDWQTLPPGVSLNVESFLLRDENRHSGSYAFAATHPLNESSHSETHESSHESSSSSKSSK